MIRFNTMIFNMNEGLSHSGITQYTNYITGKEFIKIEYLPRYYLLDFKQKIINFLYQHYRKLFLIGNLQTKLQPIKLERLLWNNKPIKFF